MKASACGDRVIGYVTIDNSNTPANNVWRYGYSARDYADNQFLETDNLAVGHRMKKIDA